MPLDEAANSETFVSKLGAILFLTSIFYLNFGSRVSPGPLMPTIETELVISHGQAGSLFLMVAVGYFISMAGSGFVSSWIGHRRTIILSALALGCTLILAGFCRSLLSLRLVLICVGLATGLYFPSGLATITNMIRRENWGKALAIHEMAPNAAFLTIPVVAEIFLWWLSWRAVFTFLGLASLALGVLYAVYGRRDKSRGEAPHLAVVKSLLAKRSFWIMAAMFSLTIGGSMGLYGMLPLYLVTEHGMERELANTYLAVSRISGPFMALMAGWSADRFGIKRSLILILVVAGVSTMSLGLLTQTPLIVMIFIQAALIACYFPPGLAAMSGIGPPHQRNVAISLVAPLASAIGGGLVPTAIGYFSQVYSMALGITLYGLVIVMGVWLLRWLKLERQ